MSMNRGDIKYGEVPSMEVINGERNTSIRVGRRQGEEGIRRCCQIGHDDVEVPGRCPSVMSTGC